ncbi:MAG: hypothetical protein LBU78_02885 [Microbacterium sp.]|jgi:hypothetical protein|nr:hypothetical protein [Microbacterium sp.]
MKRSLKASFAAASLTALALSCIALPAAQATEAPAQPGASFSAAASPTVDQGYIDAVRAYFNDKVAQLDVDAETRAALQAAGASNDALLDAASSSAVELQNLLTAAGVDRDEALDPADYQCGPTPMRDWSAGQLAQVDPDSYNWYRTGFAGLSPDLLVQYWTLMKTPQAAKDTVFGIDGKSTNEMARTWGALQKFWDIDGSGIGLVQYDAKLLGSSDQAKADRLFVYDGMAKVSLLSSILLMGAVEVGIAQGKMDGFPGGEDNPLFSVNSFAIDPARSGDSQDMLETLGITRRVAMGEGLIQVWKDLGISDAGNRAVLAHEYGHQVQYDGNLFETDITDEAEATARTELMADAFASYFTVSKRGESLNKAYALQNFQSFYNVGDCAFTNPNHHGTPNQRYAAAEWGADVARLADDQGHILPSLEVADRFEKVLPIITAPDAE